jgi:hypothetical protein
MEVRVQDREHEPEVARDGRLTGEQPLDSLLRAQVDRVDIVVERDDLVRELDVTRDERLDRTSQRAEDDSANSSIERSSASRSSWKEIRRSYRLW